ncbi:MAG: hypothetical protein AAFQ43_06095 [Bacteroidota bacterium]
MRFLPLFLLAFLVGCDAVTETDPAAPAVPSPEAFAFEPSFPTAKSMAGEHFNNGAVRVGVVSAIIGANLILPSAATHAATRTAPVVVDGVWIWESTFRINNDDNTFRLEGEPAGREVDWNLSITNRDLDDFVLYTARTDFDGQTGDWQLFYLIDGARTEVLRADFEVTGADSRELTFSVPPGRDAAGSTVLYTHDGDARGFDWFEAPENRSHLVEWDVLTKEGFIEADNYNGGVRSCWDAALENALCPSS